MNIHICIYHMVGCSQLITSNIYSWIGWWQNKRKNVNSVLPKDLWGLLMHSHTSKHGEWVSKSTYIHSHLHTYKHRLMYLKINKTKKTFLTFKVIKRNRKTFSTVFVKFIQHIKSLYVCMYALCVCVFLSALRMDGSSPPPFMGLQIENTSQKSK